MFRDHDHNVLHVHATTPHTWKIQNLSEAEHDRTISGPFVQAATKQEMNIKLNDPFQTADDLHTYQSHFFSGFDNAFNCEFVCSQAHYIDRTLGSIEIEDSH